MNSADVSLTSGLTQIEAQSRLTKYGKNALEEKKSSPLRDFLAYFWGPIPWMIEMAALMALLVRDYGDFVIILSMLIFNALLGFFEERQASDALAALKSSLALKAKALRDGKWGEIDATELVPGDVIRLYIGDVVPADCDLIQGNYLSIDQSALTGESLPVTKKTGELAYSGSIVKQGEMIAVVKATGAQTFFGKTAKLVASAATVSHFKKAVLKIGNFLIVLAVGLSIVLVADRLYAMHGVFDHQALLRLAELVLILLVASVPVAMPAVLSVTMALGAKKLAEKKVIVSRLEAIEELAGVDTLCSDKTGTLTQNKLTLGEPQPWHQVDPQKLILCASLASRVSDQDPIDLAVLAGLKDPSSTKAYRLQTYVPFDPISKRTEATLSGPSGVVQVTKGAPQVILSLCRMTEDDLTQIQTDVDAQAAKGFRTIGVAEKIADRWQFLGTLPLFDPPRADSKQTISDAKGYGVTVKMVTGDNLSIARQIAGQLGMGTNILPASEATTSIDAIENADGFAQVFPEHKFAIVKALQSAGHIVGMTGDGVNDAPALKQADVGIAVSGATEAARAAAALILTSTGLSVIVDGIAEARRIFERMGGYVLYRIAMTIDIMFFVVIASMMYGFFPLTPIMIIALALLDDVPIMAIAFDNARVSPRPARWNMNRTLAISTALGIAAVVQSLLLLYIGHSELFLDQASLQTMMFLQLVAGGHLMLLVTRTQGVLWSRPFPNIKLVIPLFATQLVAVVMCAKGWMMSPISWTLIAWIWGYNLAWMLVQDFVKNMVVHFYDAKGASECRSTEKNSRSIQLAQSS